MEEASPIVAAHGHSSNHRDELLGSDSCGCFYCLEIYHPNEIVDWTDNGQCAICPKCGNESVIGSTSGYPLTRDFLKEMHKHWF